MPAIRREPSLATAYRKNWNGVLAIDLKNSIRSTVSGRRKRHRRMSVGGTKRTGETIGFPLFGPRETIRSGLNLQRLRQADRRSLDRGLVECRIAENQAPPVGLPGVEACEGGSRDPRCSGPP